MHHLDAGYLGCRTQESSRGRRLYAALVPTGHLVDAAYKRRSYPHVISRVPPISGARSERVKHFVLFCFVIIHLSDHFIAGLINYFCPIHFQTPIDPIFSLQI